MCRDVQLQNVSAHYFYRSMLMSGIHAKSSGICFNIQHYSVHDGSGIRTTVFLKGCPLRCQWCCNPESQSRIPELAFNPEKCIGCGTCIAHSSSGVMTRDSSGCMHFYASKAVPEDVNLAALCPGQALICYGSRKTAGEVLDEVERDMAFYNRSGGGMTVSGGEPLAQPDFLRALIAEAGNRRIPVALESCGYVDLTNSLDLFGSLQMLYFDIKHTDSEKHRQFTGHENTVILQNIITIRQAFPDLLITVRTPVIPGFNDTPEEIKSIADFVCLNIPHAKYELLQFHAYGESKYHYLGR